MRQKYENSECRTTSVLNSPFKTSGWFIDKAEEILQDKSYWINYQVCIGNEEFSLAQCLINADRLIWLNEGISIASYDGTLGASRLLETLRNKNHDYSNPNDCFSNFRMCEDFGISVAEGIKVRMCDKVSRIRRLTNEANYVEGETLLDARLDLAGYIIILSLYNISEGDLTVQINEGTQH